MRHPPTFLLLATGYRGRGTLRCVRANGKWVGGLLHGCLAHLGRFSPDGEGDLDGGGDDLLGVEVVVGRTTQCLSLVSPLPVSR